MPVECLTQVEVETLRKLYRKDVTYWQNWNMAAKAAQRHGKHPLGITWVILPYKPGTETALQRQRMNAIYMECVVEYAAEFGLQVAICNKTDKLFLYNSNTVEPEWLNYEHVVLPETLIAPTG